MLSMPHVSIARFNAQFAILKHIALLVLADISCLIIPAYQTLLFVQLMDIMFLEMFAIHACNLAALAGLLLITVQLVSKDTYSFHQTVVLLTVQVDILILIIHVPNVQSNVRHAFHPLPTVSHAQTDISYT
jgi:hypothetical protein